MNRALVTGAAGFIGSHLCETLLDRGWCVRGIDSFNEFYDPARKRENIAASRAHPNFELIESDLGDLDLAAVLDGVDAIAHLAGEPGVTTSWGPAFARYVERNVMITQRLLEAVAQLGPRPLVFASSSSVYGSGADAWRAKGEPRPTSPYGVSKLAAEALVGAYSTSFGIPAVSLRYFSVYGPRQRPDMAAHRFIESLLDGRPLTVFGDGSQVRDYSYVGDVVDATVRSLSADLPPAAVLDIASGHPVDLLTLIDELRQLVGVGDAPVQQHDERRGDVPRTAGKIDLARERLGWSPATDLRAGLAAQVAWHRGLRQPQRLPRHDSVPASPDASLAPSGSLA
jgi:UDP-glucuronate 4-epimerase